MRRPLKAMGSRFESHVHRLIVAVLGREGRLDADVREDLFEAVVAGKPANGPPELAAYADKVAEASQRIDDDDIAALEAKGHSAQAIVDATVVAAVAAAERRRRRAWDLLEAAAA